MKQTKKRERFSTGYQRHDASGKPRFDLVPFKAHERVAMLYMKGGKRFGDRNWELGAPYMRFFASILRHLYSWVMRKTDEDHLAAVVWNAYALMHFEDTRMTNLDDRPKKL